MSDDERRGSDDRAEEEIVLADEDRLPWLEAVEEDQDEGGPSVAKLVAAILIGLVAIGVIVGGLYWLGNRGQSGGRQPDHHRRKGRLQAGSGQSRRHERLGRGRRQLQCQRGRRAAVQPQPQRRRAERAASPAPPQQPARRPRLPPRPPDPARPARRPAPAPAASGPTIQLGAFSTPAAAENAWRALSGRFRYLAPLGHRVVAGPSAGRTVHRLFASGANARDVCNRLIAAREACIPQ